jgi:hypothetical protein
MAWTRAKRKALNRMEAEFAADIKIRAMSGMAADKRMRIAMKKMFMAVTRSMTKRNASYAAQAEERLCVAKEKNIQNTILRDKICKAAEARRRDMA